MILETLTLHNFLIITRHGHVTIFLGWSHHKWETFVLSIALIQESRYAALSKSSIRQTKDAFHLRKIEEYSTYRLDFTKFHVLNKKVSKLHSVLRNLSSNRPWTIVDLKRNQSAVISIRFSTIVVIMESINQGVNIFPVDPDITWTCVRNYWESLRRCAYGHLHKILRVCIVFNRQLCVSSIIIRWEVINF